MQIKWLRGRVLEDAFLGDVLRWVALDALDVADPELLVSILVKDAVARLVLEVLVRHGYGLGGPWRLQSRLREHLSSRFILVRGLWTVESGPLVMTWTHL